VMREVLSDSEVPPYLDAVGREFLQQGRTAYRVLSLASSKLVPAARDTHVMTWRGTAVNSVLSVALMGAGLEVEVHDVGVTVVDSSPGQLAAILRELTECPPIEELADFVAGLRSAKLDDFVDEHLLRRLWVQRNARHRTAVSQVLWELQAARPLPSDL
jgi:ATP-dependent Lhr-like helicase